MNTASSRQIGAVTSRRGPGGDVAFFRVIVISSNDHLSLSDRTADVRARSWTEGRVTEWRLFARLYDDWAHSNKRTVEACHGDVGGRGGAGGVRGWEWRTGGVAGRKPEECAFPRRRRWGRCRCGPARAGDALRAFPRQVNLLLTFEKKTSGRADEGRSASAGPTELATAA